MACRAEVSVRAVRDGILDLTLDRATLVAAQTRWSQLVVFDWEAASNHAAADRWYSDGVHLTATGRAEFAMFLRDRLLPGGLAGIQAITIQDNLLNKTVNDLGRVQ